MKMENKKQIYRCHDCNKEILFIGDEIKNGVLLDYQQENKNYQAFKCDACFAKNKALLNFNPCEVYSRVCGYLRPVGQWNQGKQQEYKDRKEYKNNIA